MHRARKGSNPNTILFYSSLFYSILFYFILFYFILFYFILFYFILFYSILFYFILFYSILFYSILFYSILFYSILLYFILFYSILFYFIPARYTVWAKCKASDCSSTWYTYLPSSSLHNILLTFLICSTNSVYLMIGCSAQYLDESALIGTNSTYSIMQFLGVELWQWRHHGNNQVFKATTQFALQIRYQVLKALTRTTKCK